MPVDHHLTAASTIKPGGLPKSFSVFHFCFLPIVEPDESSGYFTASFSRLASTSKPTENLKRSPR
jgi:hypothetical protein